MTLSSAREVSGTPTAAGSGTATVTATGGNGTVSYGAAGLPDGVTVSPSLNVSGAPLTTGAGTVTLTARDADGDTATLSFAWSVASPNAPDTGAVLSATPNPTTGADFTVKGFYSGARDYVYFTLAESGPGGHARQHHLDSGTFSHSVTNRVNGAYTYRLTGCYLQQYRDYPEVYEVCEPVGDALAVTVNGPEPEPVAAQLADTYEARVGDLNGDGKKDLHVKRTSAAVGGGLLEDVILRQAAGGGFDVLPAPPGSGNATSASSWPLTTAVDLVLNDIDLDGFVDILLRGVGSAVGAAGVLDQILYAPGRSRPSVILNAVDDELKNFLDEVGEWTRDPDYFEEFKKSRTYDVYVSFSTCFLSRDLSKRYCRWHRPVFSHTGTYEEYTNLSDEAREFVEQFSLVDGRIKPDVTLGSQKANNIDRILSSVFGVDIFNGRLRNACAGFFDYDSASSLPCKDTYYLGRALLQGVDETRNDAEPQTDPNQRRSLTSSEQSMATQNGLGLSDEQLRDIVIVNAGTVIEGTSESADCAVFPTEPYVIQCIDRMYSYEPEIPADLVLHELAHVAQFLYNWNRASFELDENGNVIRKYYYKNINPDSTEYGYGEFLHDNFSDFDSEQQAEILRDRFRACALNQLEFNDENKTKNDDDFIRDGRIDPIAYGDHVKSIYDGIEGIDDIPPDSMKCFGETVQFMPRKNIN